MNIVFDFNTSHVTVYPVSVGFARRVNKFQYISCYCLSFLVKLIFVFIPVFQYISCYCLSLFIYCIPLSFLISIHLMLLFIGFMYGNYDKVLVFQYISCYCLSQTTYHLCPNQPYFNTSHVTVYRNIPLHLFRNRSYFNTSHVTVYQSSNVAIRQSDYHFNTSHVTVYRCIRQR